MQGRQQKKKHVVSQPGDEKPFLTYFYHYAAEFIQVLSGFKLT